MKIKIVMMTLILLITCGCVSARSGVHTQSTVDPFETDLQNASKIIGITLPVPTYFPDNYGINSVDVSDPYAVTITLSKKNNTSTTEPSGLDASAIILRIAWEASGGPFDIKLVGKRVNIKGISDGVIVDSGDHNNLW